MGGTITLAKVIAPANPAGFVPAVAGHELVAAEVTVRNTAAKAKYFNKIYTLSKLVDSQGHAYLARNTRKFPVTDCVGLPLFSVVAPGAAVTGCLVFRLPADAVPVELKISGAHPADFSIAAQAISKSRPRADVPAYPSYPATAAAPSVPATTLPHTTGGIGSEALGASSTGGTGNTGNTGTAPSTDAKGPSGTGSSATTTSQPHAYPPGDHLGLHHHKASSMTPKIKAFSPKGGTVGSAVTIIGHRLWNVTQVDFNGVVASVTSDNGGRIAVTVPAGASSGHISVTTAGGVATSSKVFMVD